NRVFDYEPRFYKPERDIMERRKRKLKFRSKKTIGRRKQTSPLIWLILAIIVIYFVLKLQSAF
ncbi:MAG: hypothetical protein A2V66_03790, partial [Ignavibacteria bacterium RBG_13_36_8]